VIALKPVRTKAYIHAMMDPVLIVAMIALRVKIATSQTVQMMTAAPSLGLEMACVMERIRSGAAI